MNSDITNIAENICQGRIFAPIQGCGRRCPTRPDCSTAEAAPSLPKTPKPTTTTKKDLQQEKPKNIR